MRNTVIILLGMLTFSSAYSRLQTSPLAPSTVHRIFVEDQTDQPTHTPRVDPSPEALKALAERAAARRASLHTMLSRGEITSGSDLYEAAFVFQHGETAPTTHLRTYLRLML